MATAQIYSAIAKKKNMSIVDLEDKLWVGSSTISKAIKRNSSIKPAMLDKLSKTFPDLDIRQMEIDALKGGEATEPDTKKPTETAGDQAQAVPALYQSIVAELIESSKAQREISKALLEERQLLRETAHAAIQLANNVKSEPLKQIVSSLERLHEEVEIETTEQETLRVFALRHIAALERVDIALLAEELDNDLNAAHEERMMNKNAGSGMLSKT